MQKQKQQTTILISAVNRKPWIHRLGRAFFRGSITALLLITARCSVWADTSANHPFAVQQSVTAGSSQQTEEKIVYLTLDDGPSPITIQILDILDRYNAKATFFVTNEMPEYAYLIKETFDRGHTIGLHTCSHNYASVYASAEAYFADLDAIGEMVRQQIGFVPCFIRFPGGSSNSVSARYTPGIMSQLVQEIQRRGYQYYDWNCSVGDGIDRTVPELV